MKPLRFTAKIAFICNLLFIVCLAIKRTYDIIHQPDINAIIILLGWMLAPFINLAVNIWIGLLLLNKKQIDLPVWLSLFNLTLLIIQIIVFLILPA